MAPVLDASLPFVPLRTRAASLEAGVLRAEVEFPGLLPRALGKGRNFFPPVRPRHQTLAEGPVLVYATLDVKEQWPDPKAADAAPPAWARAIEGDEPILRRSLVEPLLRDAVAAGEVALRPAWLGRALAKRDGAVDPARGRLDDDWVYLDVLARFPLDRDACGPEGFRPIVGLDDRSLDATRPHASMLRGSPAEVRWGPGREPRFQLFRVGELPADLYVSQALYRALKAAFGDALEAGRAAYFQRLGGGHTSPAFAQSAQESAASAQAFWSVYGSGGRGSAQERAAAVASPLYAYWLAVVVDRGPSDETRAGALGHPIFAMAYARDVDRGPRDDTRLAASEPQSALDYAATVDRCVVPSMRSRLEGYHALRLSELELALRTRAELGARPSWQVMEEAEAARAGGGKGQGRASPAHSRTPDKVAKTAHTANTAPTANTTKTTKRAQARQTADATIEPSSPDAPLAGESPSVGEPSLSACFANPGETTTSHNNAEPPAPLVFGWARDEAHGRIVVPWESRAPESRFAPGSWVVRSTRGAVERRRMARGGRVTTAVLRDGAYDPPVFRRSLVEALFADVPPQEAVLRPVQLVDEDGLIDDDFAWLDVQARFPLDRDAAEVDYVVPGRPQTSPLRRAWRYAFGPGRVPRARVFRVAEFPQVLLMAPELLEGLRRATGHEVAAFTGVPTLAMSLPAFALGEDEPVPLIALAEEDARRAAQAFWGLYRGEGGAAERALALSHPLWAFWVARLVDREGRPDTRAAALADPFAAAWYARWLDGEARADTLAATGASPAASAYLARYLPLVPLTSAPARVEADALLPPSVYAPTPEPARAARRALTLEAAPPPGTPTHATPGADELADVDHFIELALELLGAREDEEPLLLVRRLHRFIDEVRRGERKLPPRDPGRYKLRLAVLWGHQLARALGWRWATVSYAEGASLGLVSRDLAHAAFPLDLVKRAFDKRGSNTTLLLFNMLSAGDLPPSTPGAYSPVG